MKKLKFKDIPTKDEIMQLIGYVVEERDGEIIKEYKDGTIEVLEVLPPKPKGPIVLD